MSSLNIYTALSGKKSILRDPEIIIPEARYIAFTDQPLKSKVWEIFPIQKIFYKGPDPNRVAKQYKILPHKLLPESDYSIWIDANLKIIGKFPKLEELVLLKHFERNCLYDEAEVCKSMGLDKPEIIDKQINKYREEGFPKKFNSGIFPECFFLIRKNNKKINAFNEMWWNEIDKGSRRDQLSFMYCVWKSGININILPEDRNTNDFIKWMPHIEMLQIYNE